MKLVVGLGNPGPKYETTRHNVGFLAVDRLIDRWNASGPVSKYQGQIYQAQIQGSQVILLKPQTFMNLSGKCVGPIFHFYSLNPEDMIVIYDELDLPPLQIRLKSGGGTGGHNGLKSIDEHVGKDAIGYYRVRIGIGHPRILGSMGSPADHVLHPFQDQELEDLDPVLDQVSEAVEMILQGDFQKAMNKIHTKSKE